MLETHFTVHYDEFFADLAVGGDCALYALAELIIKAVGFDFDHSFQFCDNLQNPYRSKEKYTLFADLGDGNDPGVKKTKISKVFRPGKALLFHFDYGDNWFFLVTCTSVAESPAKRAFKKVLAKRGTPPVQYPDCEE